MILSKTRFAPSPTGYLHLGHVLNLLYTFALSQQKQAKVALRLEDHDKQRSKKHHSLEILKDLEWLGAMPYFESIQWQSERQELYDSYFQKIQDRCFACSCSRKDLLPYQNPNKQELFYPGICQSNVSFEKEKTIRIKVDKGLYRFHDGFLGLQEQIPSKQCGDFVIKDKLGNWSYQFCCAVDDIEENINLVIRGTDILPSTGRQMFLYDLLGKRDKPQYYHHELLKNDEGLKLSKRQKDFGIATWRESSLNPQVVFNTLFEKLQIQKKASNLSEAIAIFQNEYLKS